MKVIIVPDCHSRDFWKPVLKIKDKPVVFLGDYLDAYSYEGVSDEQGLINLKQIFDFARENKNVTLLIGNHCLSHIFYYYGCERMPYKLYPEAHKLYRDNIDLLKPFHVIDNTLFIHAGISKGWMDSVNQIQESIKSDFRITKDNVLSFIENEWLKELKCNIVDHCYMGFYNFSSSIFDIGHCRGGYEPYGGPFWNDYRYEYEDPEIGLYQIVGHCQREETGSIGYASGLACCDSRAIFEYDTDTHELSLYETN